MHLHPYETPSDDIDVALLGRELGFARPEELVAALKKSKRPTFEADRQWRRTVLAPLIDGETSK